MRFASFVRTGCLLAASLSIFACSTPETPTPNNPPGAGFENPEQTSMRAPVRVSVERGTDYAATGETDLLVHIDVAEPINYPVKIDATTPNTARLAAGTPSETVMLNRAGRVTRTFRVAGANALRSDAPFSVVVQGRTPDNSMGFYAKKQFPPEAEIVVPRRSAPVPGGRPPGMAPPR